MLLAAGGKLPDKAEPTVDRFFPSVPDFKSKDLSPERPPRPPSRTESDAGTQATYLPENLQLLQTMYGES